MPADKDHITCLDTFSINPDVQTEGAFDACLGRSAPEGLGQETTVSLLPGLEVVDLYNSTLRAEVWKDGSTSECLVPRAVVGWEFFSLLWPQPEGAFPIKIGGAVELLLARAPAAEVVSSALFAYVPRGQSYSAQDKQRNRAGSAPRVRFEEDVEAGSQAQSSSRSASSDPRSSGRPLRERRSALQCELLARNLDSSKRSLVPRITVLYPWATFRDMKMLPDEEESWSLWIAPRNRTLMLLNRHLGRIDLHLAVLFTVDSVFRGGAELSGAFARLFEALGTRAQAGALFHPFNPLKIHCGFTNAVVAEHVRNTVDGRGDYAEILGGEPVASGLPSFFVSNASSNLCFLTPLEAHLRRGGAPAGPSGPSGPLAEGPLWTMRGPVTEADLHELSSYRMRVPAERVPGTGASRSGGCLSMLLGLNQAVGSWPLSGRCSDVSFAPGACGGSRPPDVH